MAKRTIAAAAALFSIITTEQVFAQSFSEPAAFQAQHPDRDVLNGGALTPAARAAAGLDSPRGAYRATGSMDAGSVPRAYVPRAYARSRRYR
jgi:hypothetical protein